MSVDEALKRAYESRSDLQAAQANVRAAEYSRRAALAGRYPTVPSAAITATRASTSIPRTASWMFAARSPCRLFTGGMVHGDVVEADAQLQQARDRLENLRSQIDSDVRVALFNLNPLPSRSPWRKAISILPSKALLNRATVLPPASPIPWKWFRPGSRRHRPSILYFEPLPL